jgi:hypothetical protein
VQQRRAVPARRARCRERGIFAQQRLEDVAIAVDYRIGRGLEAQDAAVASDELRKRREIVPALEGIASRRDELRILEIELFGLHVTDLLVVKAGMLPLESPRRRLVALVQGGEQRLGLQEVLAERGGEGEGVKLAHGSSETSTRTPGDRVTSSTTPSGTFGPKRVAAATPRSTLIETTSLHLILLNSLSAAA